MAVYALSDPHLSFGVPQKSMEVFGPLWKEYAERIEENWRATIRAEDLVLIPGDISWAIYLEDALVDLKWIDKLPGTKLLLRGNHDYWWSSPKKMREVMPSSIHFIQNDVFNWNGISIGGARLWDTEEFSFGPYIDFQENPQAKKRTAEELASKKEEDARLFERELQRLELSLKNLDPHAKTRIALTHYPPISADLKPSRASAILEKYKVEICVFGHLHNLKKGVQMFGEAGGIRYLLTSCDYLDFFPLRVL
ncbi:MAG: metallophosphoesterase [Chlamydiales bacterium]|nr:metallophosphoesterase [Chlamydiales bacterium]